MPEGKVSFPSSSKLKHHEVIAELVNSRKYSVIAEIGVYSGSFTRHILKKCRQIKSYFAIDPWKVLSGEQYRSMGKLIQADWDALYFRVCQTAPFYPALTPIRMTSLEASKLFGHFGNGGYFDLVYIDTTHFYQDTIDDIRAWYPLVKSDGALAGHDYGTGRGKGHRVDIAVNDYFGRENISVHSDGVWIKEA